MAAAAAAFTRRSTLQLWCVAKNNAEDAALQSALDWACGAGRADCNAIQPGGPCFEPQDIQSYASYAFNDYFLKNGIAKQNCDFAGAAAITALNPSHGKCTFPSSGSSATNGSFVGLTTPGVGDISGGGRHRQVAIFVKIGRLWMCHVVAGHWSPQPALMTPAWAIRLGY
ncbi:hypothetical protein ACLOJK_009407 [Asimina triloba]